ncbi:MAG: hypothetical protein HFJ28_01990 [Clostridia bacterium]|jgi:predicted SprT family Zn-dependent metalloprotease|nr:hypothetical protein [Clostridia bacterium]
MIQQKLNQLYNECIKELQSINIDMQDEKIVGKIEIKISKRANKRYGCCKQENPDPNYKTIQKRRNIHYERFQNHYIEISSWVMQLNDNIIKNTIIHELIHCIPYCNNHKAEFKKYAKYINQNLGYQITTRGNKKQDYQASNLEYEEEENYKYKIKCTKCEQVIYRKRFNSNLIKKYRCGKCGGKLQLIEKK